MRGLETERLHLRPMDERDEALYCRIYTDAELMKHVGEPLTSAAALAGFAKVCRFNREDEFRYRCWAIVERETGDIAGLAALMGNRERAEFGMMVLPDWQSRGLAQEVVPRLVDLAFEEYGVAETFTRHLVANRAGAAVMRKLGFKPAPESADIQWQGWLRSRAEWLSARRVHGSDCMDMVSDQTGSTERRIE